MSSLDTAAFLKRHDPSGMGGLVDAFPGQCRSAALIGAMAALPRSYRRAYDAVVCTGLGGSAIGADIARSYLAGSIKTPFIVNRDYLLPGFVGRRTLVIAASYSGDTEETLCAYRDARKKRAAVIVISSGGKLTKLADRDGYPVVAIPGGFPPRAALGYSFFPLLFALAKVGIIPDPAAEIDEAIATLQDLRDRKIGAHVPTRTNLAKRAALSLSGRLAVIYSAQAHCDAAATRWRGQLAENAKALAMTNAFPEMNHNEIMGWRHPRELLRRSAVVILRDAGDHPRVARRMDITARILAKEAAAVLEVRSAGAGLLARIFSLIYTGDFASLYLAALYKTDPTAIDRINYLKKELART